MESSGRISREGICQQWAIHLQKSHQGTCSLDSRMTVSLAAQVGKKVCATNKFNYLLKVLSSSVAKCFLTLRTLGYMVNTEETEKFCQIFDKFFDMFNARNVREGEITFKSYLKPFYTKEDVRLKVTKLD